ncbi:dihydrofolate reductase [Pseudorhodoplanes sp.]|uniref:dihydrofolate reductase n=1 Tax=Pseudorhodoplanes sp. TaxID=1934341 RepID=UPI002BA17033|nr:dihydrofolate reductase [Pseudorhodoplanes sp.]HWV41792.1 dihydrofolate reductase [Pseudorhodoplanes sp.]
MTEGATRPRGIAIVLVVAVAENGVIGRDNKLPWRIKSDLKFFKSVTMDRPVVMGRKTYDSIGKPLPGRTNIVITRRPDFAAPGILVAPGVEPALAAARGDALRRGADTIAVIGGTEIFAQTLPLADRIILTLVHAKPVGDTYFPDLDPAVWREAERLPQPKGPDDEYGFTIVHYQRAGAA